MIEATNLTKMYGRRRAVDELTFTVHPGRITGFLGPNGAGKSTTMRLILGLAEPTSGRVCVNGRPYREIARPLREVGALLEARCTHPARTARHHLRYLAHSSAIPPRRVDEVLDVVGLVAVADRRTGGFSLGMTQRLGIAAALLGDPSVLLLDEPVNGLDTEGIRWIRGLLRDLAGEGRTVLLSSHLMGEMEQTADQLIVIGAGRLLADEDMRSFIEHHSRPRIRVQSPQLECLGAELTAMGAQVTIEAGAAVVEGMVAADIGQAAVRVGAVLHELSPRLDSLEEVYTRMTADSVEYRGAGVAA